MNEPTAATTTIEILTTCDPHDAAAIGALLPHLSTNFTDAPIAAPLLQDIIASPYHDQLVARDTSGRIVGTATLTVTMGAAVGRNAWLEDFVVDPELQGSGIGGKLWDQMLEWCRDHDVKNLGFTSNPTRRAAHAFYLKRGAVIRDTSYFKKSID